MSGVDGGFLPGSGGGFKPAETPVKLRELVEGLEKQQIAVLHYMDAEGPTGSYCLGFEMTSGERWILMASRMVGDSHKYKAVLVWRKLRSPQVWTPARRKHFASGRDADATLGPPDELQQRVEGQVIRGLRFADNPTRYGGEEQEIEFSDGSLLMFSARPISRTMYDPKSGMLEYLTADVEWALTYPPTKPLIV